jgi:cytidylate kinase
MVEKFFHRITISGDPGSGKSVFAHNVMEMTGYRMIYTGLIFRKLAAQRDVSVMELNEQAENQKDIDYEVDEYVRSYNSVQENLIFDSRMAWNFLDNALKVRLTVDPEIAARRIYHDTAEMREKYPDVETATKEVEKRKQSEIQRYLDLYGVDISDETNFDIVIDTSNKTPEEVMSEFETAFEDYKNKYS